jgi:hypothetical protein
MKYQVHLQYTSTLGTDIHVLAACIEEAEEIARELFNNEDLGDLKWYGVDGEGLEECYVDITDADAYRQDIANSQPTFVARPG